MERHFAAARQATAAARLATPASLEDHDALGTWLVTWGHYLGLRDDHHAVIDVCQLLDRINEEHLAGRPGRLETLRTWSGNRGRLHNALMTTQRFAEAFALAESSIERLAPVARLWPRHEGTALALVTAHHNRVAALAAAGDERTGAACAELRRAVEQTDTVALAGATVSFACSRAMALIARQELATAGPTAALAAVETAQRHEQDCLRYATLRRIRMAPEPALRLLHAEILLQLDRQDDAAAQLEATGERLPHDLLAQVPALARHRDHPRLAALLQRAAAGR